MKTGYVTESFIYELLINDLLTTYEDNYSVGKGNC
jgi:hypothetical protein